MGLLVSPTTALGGFEPPNTGVKVLCLTTWRKGIKVCDLCTPCFHPETTHRVYHSLN